jgi:hypothetical protein
MLLTHDSTCGLHWARGCMQLYDGVTGRYTDVSPGEQVPEWVRRAANRNSEHTGRVSVPVTWDVSLFRGLRETASMARTWGWPKVVELLSRYRRVAAKADLPLWSAASWPAGASTCRTADVEAVGMLVLDYDDGTMTLEDAARRWGRWQSLIHTSPSHRPETPRFRVVVPLARPVPASDWPRAWRWAARWGGAVDHAAKDAGRRYYLPGGDAPEVWRLLVQGDRRPWLHLDADRLPPEPTAPVRAVIPRPPSGPLPETEARREIADRLKADPDLRASAGIRLGGQISSGNVRAVPCPQCGDRSVWWPLAPTGTPKALCNHRNSCGWSGWIDTLLT